jgi:hypothetical protein
VIAVAIVALAIGVGFEARRMPRRRAICLGRAAYHADLEQYWLQMARLDRENACDLLRSAARLRRPGYVGPSAEPDEWAQGQAEEVEEEARAILDVQIPDDLRLSAYHARQRRRFEEAAARPWRPVPPEDE